MKFCLGLIKCPRCRDITKYIGDEKWCLELISDSSINCSCGWNKRFRDLAEEEMAEILIGETTIEVPACFDSENYAINLVLNLQSKQFKRMYDDV